MRPTLFSTLLTGLIVVILNQTSGFTIRQKLNCSGIPADVAFALDSSSSIWDPHFDKQLDFVSYLVNQLDIGMGPNQVRVGVEIFSDYSHVKINFDQSIDKVAITNQIKQITRLVGDTNTADALNKLRQTMFQPEQGSRNGVKRVALILTDGASTNEAATQKAAKACRDAGIQLFAIGIGRHIKLSELIGIASEPKGKYLIRATSYEDLDRIRDTMVERTCHAVVNQQPTSTTTSTRSPTTTTTTTTTTSATTTTPQTSTTTKQTKPTSPETTTPIPSTTPTTTTTPEPVTTQPTTTVETTHSIPIDRSTQDWLKPADDSQDERACRNKVADVFFLLDSSSSIRIDEFKKQINAIEDIVKKFDIGATKTRVGLSVFSHKYKPELNFNSGSDKTLALLKIRNVRYMGGGTTTGKALHQVRSHVFDEGSVRAGAERILIVFTDGMSIDYERTSAEAKLLQQSGVKIFVVGIGPDVDQNELEDIASDPSAEFVHTFASFDILLAKSGLLTYKACTVDDQTFAKDQNACDAARLTDVVFMVSSNRFGKEKTDRILKASAEVIKKVGSRGAFRYGTMFDDCPPTQDLAVGTVTDPAQLTGKIVNFKYNPLSSLLFKLQQKIIPRKSWNSRQVGLIFLDNTIDLNDPQLFQQARNAFFRNIELYVVIIGEGVDINRVQNVLVSRERIINVYSYETLPSYLPFMFVNRFCVPPKKGSDIKPPIS